MRSLLKPAHSHLIAAALLLLMAVQLIHLSRVTSITWDEGHHLFDGYTIWTKRDFRLNPEVPPFIKLAAAAPLLHQPLYVPPNQERAEQTEAFLDGRSFLVHNGYDRILFPARMACMVFTLALGLFTYLFARELFGPISALVGLALFAGKLGDDCEPDGKACEQEPATSLHSGPGYMAYANEAWGGPDNVHKYLSDANSDWGQQLKEVKTYIDRNHITNCWFAYFVDGVVEPSDYGINCKRLPTTETTLWMDLPMDVPPVITGTVFLSDSDLEGIEYGQGALNPYDSFRRIKPTVIIQHGLFVYDGTFAVPLASALDQSQKAQDALVAKQLDPALQHAREAVLLAPQSATAQATLADVLVASGRAAQAHMHYAIALNAVRTIEPALQAGLVAGLTAKLAQTAGSSP